jgi:hypothetical protein
MRPQQIDSGIPDVLGQEEIVLEETDAIDKILAASPLAAFVGFTAAEQFNASTAQRDRKFADHYKALAAKATKKNPPAQPETSDALEKIYNPSLRRKIGLTNYLKSMLAQGETVQAIVSHAEKHDAHTADLFREIAREIGAA